MHDLTADEVRELWLYREQWVGSVSATDSATPLDVVGWVLSRGESVDPTFALAFFEEAVQSGTLRRVFAKVATLQWERDTRRMLASMKDRNGVLRFDAAKEPRRQEDLPYYDFFATH